jgi:glycosyltransferase involved in cell wall biosynthesis
MRLLYFSTDFGPHDHRFLSALASTSHDVHFVRLARLERQVEDRPVPSAVKQVAWAGGRGLFRWRDVPKLVRDLKRVIRDIRPDLIHAGPVQTCAFIAVLTGFRPILTMSWGFDLMQDADRSWRWRWITRFTLRRSEYFVSDASVTRSRAVEFGVRPDRTAVFPWGVDLRHFSPRTRAARRSVALPRKRAAKRPFVLFCNRSWEPRYGVDILVRAFALAAKEHPALSLVLLGGGSQASIIRHLLLDGGLLDRVQFGGQVAQASLPRWYHSANLFISPSHVDGSSVSLMEALACGMPVLVSDIPANKEWVRDNHNGWLFRDGDVEELARKILWISAHRTVLPRIGRAARKIAEARADWNKNFKVLLRAYSQAVEAA